MIRAPRKGFWPDQLRAGIVGVFVVAACLAALEWSGVPDRIESKVLEVTAPQGG